MNNTFIKFVVKFEGLVMACVDISVILCLFTIAQIEQLRGIYDDASLWFYETRNCALHV